MHYSFRVLPNSNINFFVNYLTPKKLNKYKLVLVFLNENLIKDSKLWRVFFVSWNPKDGLAPTRLPYSRISAICSISVNIIKVGVLRYNTALLYIWVGSLWCDWIFNAHKCFTYQHLWPNLPIWPGNLCIRNFHTRDIY